MENKMDDCICVDDYYVYKIDTTIFKKNETYKFFIRKDITGASFFYEINYLSRIYWQMDKQEFYTYFITLAEWREKQINSILED